MAGKLAIARALREIALLLEFRGENPFKIRAYETGALALENLVEDFDTLVASRRLTDVAGIGPALAAKIDELHRTGKAELLERLRREVPSGIAELVRVPDLGPKKIAALHARLGIQNVDDLKRACETGIVRSIKGFGAKTEQKILDGIRRFEARERRWLLAETLDVGRRIAGHLSSAPGTSAVEIAGSTRRWKETVADLDVVAATDDPVALADHFLRFPSIASTIARGGTKTSVRLANDLQVDLRAVPAVDFATALHHFTGSKTHHVKLRGLARDRGLTVSEWGVARIADGAKLPIATEHDLYAALGLPFVPPELREDEGEFEAALSGTLPEDLVTAADLRGAVHCHTVESDGKATLEEMARAADALGLDYLTVTDHSASAGYAGGLDIARLERQWDDIARVQEHVSVRLLRGTESDILADGALDYPDHVLEKLDVVIASIHSRFKMDPDTMTRRLVRAMRQPVFKIWGHPLGRLLGKRPPFDCRVEEVLDAAAESRAAIEINGDPRRLDLEPRWVRAARQRGLRFVISTDAHSTAALANQRFGVGIARRGWVTRGEVLNALPFEDFRSAVRPAA